jgi:transcriptional regulator with XRE-family HTH domain
MRIGKRTRTAIEAEQRAAACATGPGLAIRQARKRRHVSQSDLAVRIGAGQSTISRIECGRGAGVRIARWLRLALELGLAARFEIARDPADGPADAGHLAIQELLLRVGRAAGYTGTFELPTRPSGPGRSIDVCLRNASARRLLVLEAWNVVGDVGRAARSFDRKLAAARESAEWLDGGGYRVHGAWVVRATRRNRALVSGYPHVFGAKLPGSSAAWVRALVSSSVPPDEPGLPWCDVAATRLFAWRRSGMRDAAS